MSETYTLCPTDDEGECTIEGHRHPAWDKTPVNCPLDGQFVGDSNRDVHADHWRLAEEMELRDWFYREQLGSLYV